VNRQENQKWYKELLDRQQKEKDTIGLQANKMTHKEKKINIEPLHAYKDIDTSHITALLPGYANSKYIHPYSPEARYASILQYKNVIPRAPTRDSGTVGHNTNKSGFEMTMQHHTQPALVPPSEDIKVEHPDEKPGVAQKRHLAALLSPSHANKFETAHNPITNPIPYNLQNPYLIQEFRKVGTLPDENRKNGRYLRAAGSQSLVHPQAKLVT
jgi:hypothetical protein